MAIRELFDRFRQKGPPFVEGNHIELLVDGGPFFRSLLDAITNAEHYVFVESYIVEADGTGWAVAEALMERARAGVEVAFSVDGVGSLGLDPRYLAKLKEAGVKVLTFKPVSLLKGQWPWSQRNHRKIVVVDGKVGIVGGMNISNDYAASQEGGQGWRDSAVRVTGPAVAQLEALFRRLWSRTGGDDLQSTHKSVGPVSLGAGAVRFLANFGRRDRAFIRKAYLLAITSAEATVRIMNAYFIPDRVIVRALVQAANRGVDVELIVAGATDVTSALYATRSLYAPLLKAGIRIYEWNERILHAKTAVIDGSWSTIGSSNLDYLSSFRNLEVNAVVLSTECGAKMDAQFTGDRTRARQVTLVEWKSRPWARRIIDWMFGRMSRLVR